MATDLQKEFCSLRDTYIEKQFGRLNEMQRQAVFTTSGPLLILAGAGSGKTTVLVNRIANLIRFGSAHGSSDTPRPAADEDLRALRTAIMTGTDVPAWLDGMMRCEPARSWNIMAITFTNKAAGELKARLRSMLGDEEGDEVFASTFHSACVRILRRYAEEIGWPRSFTIYDTDDAQRVMKALYKEQNVDEKFYPVRSMLNQLGRWKDQLTAPADAAKEAAGKTKPELAARLYGLYEKRLQEAGAFDFDGLIYYTVRLLQEHKEARDYYQNRYHYLLVDEYQDTSVAQFQLVSLLTGPAQNICVVGDDDQSIYRFRGATIENILNFERYYPGAKVIRLEQNYRSTSNILNAANCVICHNTERKGKTLWTKNGEGAPVHVYQAEDDREEAAHIAEVIGQHLRAGGRLSDHAVLYRMNAQSAPLENYFTRAGIPHKIVGGQRFNDRKEVKDIHSYMSIVANPRDDVRLRRIINEPARKIGASTVDTIAELAGQEGVSMMDIISHADEYARLSRAVGPLLKFWQIYQALQQALDTCPLDLFAEKVIELTGYRQMLRQQAAAGHREEAEDRENNLAQLVNNVKNYCDTRGVDASLEGYLEEIALISDIDSYNADADQVVMMTIHSAKGLEFPYVFLVLFGGGPGGGAPPGLCGHHPGQAGAVHLPLRHPDALRPHLLQRAQPLFERDRPRLPGDHPQPRPGAAQPALLGLAGGHGAGRRFGLFGPVGPGRRPPERLPEPGVQRPCPGRRRAGPGLPGGARRTACCAPPGCGPGRGQALRAGGCGDAQGVRPGRRHPRDPRRRRPDRRDPF